MGICHIIGAGEITPEHINKFKNVATDDLILAADGGCRALLDAGITPDAIIGDFDSFNGNPQSLFALTTIIALPPEKDFTDMHTCVNYGREKGFKAFCLYGGTGGRIDHTFANIQLMHGLANDGCQVTMFGKDNTFHVISNGKLDLESQASGYISIFSLSDKSLGVTLTNLRYELCDATLTNSFALGVSNEFVGKPAHIKVNDGTLLIVCPAI